MKIKNKGKVHPSPSSSSSSSSSSPSDGFVLSILQLLPAAILASVSVLSTQDKEVLAYLITRSMKTAPNTTQDSNKKPPKKPASSKTNNNNNVNSRHKPPMFDCECFDCYRSYWFKWNSSPDRHLIHEAIEAFEDHLAHSERSKKSPGGRGKKRDKMGRREAQKPVNITPKDQVFPAPENVEASAVVPVVLALPPPCDVVSVSSPPKAEVAVEDGEVDEQAPEEDMALVVRAAAASNHRGLVRKVLPDVLGLFNSRLWNLWSPDA